MASTPIGFHRPPWSAAPLPLLAGFMRFFSLGGETPRERTPAPAAAERRRTDISSTCHRVEDLLEQHLWNEAGSVLDAGLRGHPDEPELIDLRNRAQRQIGRAACRERGELPAGARPLP